MPEWRNGRRDRLKIDWWQHRGGSSPLSGTRAQVAKLVDALRSGRSESNLMEVQVFSWAHVVRSKLKNPRIWGFFAEHFFQCRYVSIRIADLCNNKLTLCFVRHAIFAR